MYIRNLTPHSVTVAGITIEPSGIVARVSAATADAGSVDFNGTTIPLTTTVYGEVQNLPAQRDDTLLIVSSLVAARQSAMGRPAPEFSGCRKKLYLYSEHSLRQYEGSNREYIT